MPNQINWADIESLDKGYRVRDMLFPREVTALSVPPFRKIVAQTDRDGTVAPAQWLHLSGPRAVIRQCAMYHNQWPTAPVLHIGHVVAIHRERFYARR
jgi:hypothetical protein